MNRTNTMLEDLHQAGYQVEEGKDSNHWRITRTNKQTPRRDIDDLLVDEFDNVATARAIAYTHYLTGMMSESYPPITFGVAKKADTGFCDHQDASERLIFATIDDLEIVDFFTSECGRFDADPEEAYGISLEHAILLNNHNGIVFSKTGRAEIKRQTALRKKVWIMPLPVISTVHLAEPTSKYLATAGDENPWMYCGAYEKGFCISVPSSNEFSSEIPKPPEDLVAIWNWGRANSFTWVRIDCDGDTISDLDEHHWN